MNFFSTNNKKEKSQNSDEKPKKQLFVALGKEQEIENTIIELENIQKTYLLGVEGVPALRGVNCKITRGEFIIVYGTSGGGKTSLLNIIGTIDKPTKGFLTICGKRITSNTKDSDLATLRLQRMGFVFQNFNLLPTMTALENVEMPMTLRGKLNPFQRRRRAKELLAKVGMGDRLHHVPAQLSGGEQQRVTIARSIANNPDILLLDEPTGDLDTKNTLNVMSLLQELNRKEGITMVMVTHDPNLKNAASRVIYMRDGRIQHIEIIPVESRDEFFKTIETELSKTDFDYFQQSKLAQEERKNMKSMKKKKQTMLMMKSNPEKQTIGQPLMLKFSSKTKFKKPFSYDTTNEEGAKQANELLYEFCDKYADPKMTAEKEKFLKEKYEQVEVVSNEKQPEEVETILPNDNNEIEMKIMINNETPEIKEEEKLTITKSQEEEIRQIYENNEKFFIESRKESAMKESMNDEGSSGSDSIAEPQNQTPITTNKPQEEEDEMLI